MRRSFCASALVASAFIALSLAAACSGGGGHSATASPTPTPGIPQNVVATGGYATYHLQWDAVGNVTGYRIFLSPAAITTTAGLTSIFVVGPPYDTTATNWQALHARIAAVNGSAEGGLSADVSATPTAGWIVANHTTGATVSLDFFHADDGVMTSSVPDGTLLFNALVGTTASLYSVLNPGHTAYQEIGSVTGAGAAPFAAVAGHTYRLLGRTTDRVIVEDHDGGALWDVRSFSIDGGDEKLLKGSCSAAVASHLENENGAVFDCNVGGLKWWVSDGLAAATQLPNESGAGFTPVGLTADRIFFFDTNPTPDRSLIQSRTTPATAPVVLLPSTTVTTILAIGTAGVLVKNVNATAAPYSIYVDDFSGATIGTVFLNNTSDFTLDGVLPDHSAALVHGGSTANAYIASLDVGTSPVRVDAMQNNGAASAMLVDGTITIVNETGTGWFATPQTGGTGIAFPNSNGSVFRGAQNGWVVLYNTGTADLTAYSTTTSASHVLSTTASALPIVFHSDLTVVWIDADGTTHLAKADGSLAPTQIDATPATALLDAGSGSDGRIFYNANRSATHVEVMRWDPSLASSVAVSGAGSESGHYFPR